jgi:polyhydroxybutyrate depolymerase
VFFNGTADPIMPYEGGAISSIPALGIGAGGNVLSVNDTLGLWAGKNGCGSLTSEAIEDSAPDDTTVEKITYSGCSGALQAFEITGGGHAWPGSVGGSSLMGNVSRDINATTEIIDFFKTNGLTPAP